MTSYNATICPSGMYCPSGTEYKNQYKCPRGTFNNKTGLREIEQCNPCSAGFYCDEEGQSTVVKLCSAGTPVFRIRFNFILNVPMRSM